MSHGVRFGLTRRGWRVAGALAGTALAAVFLGCMSLNIGCGESVCTTPVGVTTDASGVVKQQGKVTVGPGCQQQVFYPICYAGVPNLEIRESGCFSPHHEISRQEKDCFYILNTDSSFSHTFHWTARGVREVAVPPPGAPAVIVPGAAPTLPAPKEALPPMPVPVAPGK